MTESNNPSCPKCGAPIPENAPQSLCPKCVFENAATVPASKTTVPGVLAPPASVEELAEHFPDLEIVELIGAGGMGAVYKARQPKLDRFVALKILTRDLAEDPAFVERFNREARVLAKLSHPNIVTVFDFGTAGPFCFLLMEFIDGVNLRQAMHAGRFTAADSLALVQDICGALSFAHEEGILHRDIKPENILIDTRGRVKIADFGIAKLVGEQTAGDVTLTMQGAILGSPQYMAPEQIETPGDVDQRADIYSLGVVFYELLTGELPLGRFAAPSAKSPLDPRIDEIVFRTLEKERQLRYQSADEIRTKVETLSEPAPAGGGAADSAPSSATAPADPTAPAKFATASAILTGLGLVMCTVFVAALPLFAADMHRNPDDRKEFAILMLTGGLIVGSTLLVGMILGAKALGEIRQSGGQKPGLGSAMFGALTVPVLLALGATGAIVPIVVLALSDGVVNGDVILALAALIAAPIAAVMFVRTAGRWARGGADPATTTSGTRVAASAGFVVFAILFNVFVMFWWNQSDAGPDPLAGKNPTKTVSKSTDKIHDPNRKLWDTYWPGDHPHQTVRLTVPEGNAATIELVRTDASGKESVAAIWAAIAPDSGEFEGVLALGAPADLQAKQQEGVAALRGTLWSLKGGPVMDLNKFYMGKLMFSHGYRDLDLSDESRDRSRDTLALGNLQPDDGGPAEFLSLRFSVAPRPGPPAPFVLSEGLIGMDQPAVVLDQWLKLTKAEKEPEPEKTAATDADIELKFVAPAGRVSVFTLQMPWSHDQEPPDDFYVVASDDEDFNGTIKISVRGAGGNARSGRGISSNEVSATLHGPDGKPVAQHKFFVAADHTLSLPSAYPVLKTEGDEPDGKIVGHTDQELTDTLDLSRQGLHFLNIGHHVESKIDESLRLFGWSVARPDPDKSMAVGRIGATSPPEAIDGWIKQKQRRLWEVKLEEPPRDFPLLSLSDATGTVRARSGFMFDTYDRIVVPPTQIYQTESLFLKKGSEAKGALNGDGVVHFGPQSDDAVLVMIDERKWLLNPLSGLRLQVDEIPAEQELVIDTVFSAQLKISETVAFNLSSLGKLHVFEGKLDIDGYPEGRSTTLSAGQEITLPKPPLLEENVPSGTDAP